MEVFVNCLEPKDMTFFGETTNGSMKMTYCSNAKLVSTYDLQKIFIATKDMENLLRQITQIMTSIVSIKNGLGI
jgi:hypothetical protein